MARRKKLQVGAAEVFQAGVVSDDKLAQTAKENELLQEIGRLTVELNWLKKKCPASANARRLLIDRDHGEITIARQCELLGLPRSTHYYRPASESPKNLELLRWLDEQYMRTPCYGSRRMTALLQAEGISANRKRVQRLMGVLGVAGLTPKRNLRSRRRGIAFSRICCGMRRFRVRTRSGARTSPTFRCEADSCI